MHETEHSHIRMELFSFTMIYMHIFKLFESVLKHLPLISLWCLQFCFCGLAVETMSDLHSHLVSVRQFLAAMRNKGDFERLREELREEIWTYRDVSECIGTCRAWFSARKPIPDTFRYILIHSDTSRYMIIKLRVPKKIKQHFGLIFHHNCQPPIVLSLNRHLSTVKSSLQHCRSFFGCSTFVSVLAGIEQTW